MKNIKRTTDGATDTPSPRTFFTLLERWVGLESYFINGLPVDKLPKAIFLLVLGLLYIHNAHNAEEGVRRLSRLQIEVEDLRADYTTLKADIMFAEKQSEIAKRAKSIGIVESVNPPTKIIVQRGKY